MARYKLIIHCKDLSIPSEDAGENIIGFYTTRFESGKNIELISEKVLTKFKSDKEYLEILKIHKKRVANEPIIEIEGHEKVPFHKGRSNKPFGFTFYTK